MKRVGCYLRVSTTEQTVENQRNDLRAYCKARGWDDVIEYTESAFCSAGMVLVYERRHLDGSPPGWEARSLPCYGRSQPNNGMMWKRPP